MRSGRGQRSRRFAVAVLPLCAWGCASSTPIDVDVANPATVVASEAPVPTTVEELSDSTTEPTVSTTESPTTTAEPDCVGLVDFPSATRTFDQNGVPRTYRLAMPILYDGTRATPMIVNFHGPSATAQEFDTNTAMSKLATQRGFIVVTPDSTSEPQSWNVRADPDRVDDFVFIHSLLAELQLTLCLDSSRIFVSGHANGATFATYVACSAPFEFAAIAMVSAPTAGVCPPEVQPSVLAIAGTADESNQYDDPTGGGAVDVTTGWAEHDACGEPITVAVRDGVEAIEYDGCAAGASVVLMTVEGGAHPWPGSSVAANLEENSEAGKKFDATSAILTFFEAHGRG